MSQVTRNQGRLPFDPKFRNGDYWYGNFLGKVPENPEIVEFLKSERFNRKSGNSGMKVKWNGNFQEKFFENLGIPHEVVLFFGIMQIPNFLLGAS